MINKNRLIILYRQWNRRLELPRIIPFDQYHRSGTIWSPDSDKLVLPVIDTNGDSQIMVVCADGSQSHSIAEGILAFWSWK